MKRFFLIVLCVISVITKTTTASAQYYASCNCTPIYNYADTNYSYYPPSSYYNNSYYPSYYSSYQANTYFDPYQGYQYNYPSSYRGYTRASYGSVWGDIAYGVTQAFLSDTYYEPYQYQ